MDTTALMLMGLILVGVNALGVAAVAFQLPGTWLILLASAAFAWWRWDQQTITWWALGTLLALAVAGEIVEFLAGAMGAGQAGASKRAVVLAIVGGVIGAIVGTVALSFIPILGTLIGAAVGAGLGSAGGDLAAGRELAPALRSGRGAAIGRLGGAAAKLAIAAVMWVVAAAALVW